MKRLILGVVLLASMSTFANTTKQGLREEFLNAHSLSLDDVSKDVNLNCHQPTELVYGGIWRRDLSFVVKNGKKYFKYASVDSGLVPDQLFISKTNELAIGEREGSKVFFRITNRQQIIAEVAGKYAGIINAIGDDSLLGSDYFICDISY